MNLYDKRSKVTRMNGIPINVEPVSRGIRYKNLKQKVVVEVFNTPILLLDGKIDRWLMI